jgi:alpha-galactosidase
VWTKPLSGGRVAVGLFNRSWSVRDVSVNLSEIGFQNGGDVRDIWEKKDLGHRSGIVVRTLPKHGAALLIVSR